MYMYRSRTIKSEYVVSDFGCEKERSLEEIFGRLNIRVFGCLIINKLIRIYFKLAL